MSGIALDSALISALLLGDASRASVILREREEIRAAEIARDVSREEARKEEERNAARREEQRQVRSRTTAVLLLSLVAYSIPGAIGYIQGGGQDAPLPTIYVTWAVGIGAGFFTCALARRFALESVSGSGRLLTNPVIYAGLGFVLYMAMWSIGSS